MKVLVYNNIEYHGLKKQFDKVAKCLEEGDFQTADVKKLNNSGGFYRAKLDEKNRLLFKIGEYAQQKYIFALEVIANHTYEKSRFLAGANIDESRLEEVHGSNKAGDLETFPAAYINSKNPRFNFLDKILCFDEAQEEVFHLPLPLIIIGSAGSGKTALTLEKIKGLPGKILYVTLSNYLVENSKNLYYSNSYDNQHQEVEFLSFRDFMGALEIPKGHEVDFRVFDQWIWRYRQAFKIKDSYRVFEEFKGVLTGSVVDKAWLDLQDYKNLGVRRSIFSPDEREAIYPLFLKYLEFLDEGNYYDNNITAYHYLSKVQPVYDYIVVDEVQDITNIQLFLMLQSLKQPSNFMLCGDSNQIVHPNFFSWTNVKSLFYQKDLQRDIARILVTNYRNTAEVTQIANQLLKVKNARFGSIDKESTYLVKPNSTAKGTVEFFEDSPNVKQELDKKTGKSAKFAVIVMRSEDKPLARKFFHTPLLFSVQEAKGLEYENIILYNIISNNEAEFRELCNGVAKTDLEADLVYGRARDKGDKSLEAYKFYVNSLYVAITRAVKNLYVIESAKKHDLLQLLELTQFSRQVNMKDQASSMDDWQKEARRLELQGKLEQAEEIRKSILKVQPVPWEVLTHHSLKDIVNAALDPVHFNKKAKDTLFEYAVLYGESQYFPKLSELKYRRADNLELESKQVLRRVLNDYFLDKINNIKPHLQKYGLDFRNPYNQTPLMLGAMAGAASIIKTLVEAGANLEATDTFNRNAFQLALLRSFNDEQFGKKSIAKVYHLLIADSLKLRFAGRLIKIHNRQMEFFIFNYMIALGREIVYTKGQWKIPGFQTADFLTAIEHYSDQVMPEYRKNRAYISSILAKNELFGKDPYNKLLFCRVERGYYIINPKIEIAVGEEWISPFFEFIGEDSQIGDKPEHVLRFQEFLGRLLQSMEEEKKQV